MTEQEKLIGKHPESPHILGEWLTYVDQPTTAIKKHRKLTENIDLRRKAIDYIATWIIEHHIIEQKIDFLERKAQILQKYEFDKFVDFQHLLPTADITMKGNVTEIIFVEYLKESTNFTPFIYKLRYNPNVEQSMKGDDVLLFNPAKVFDKVIYGESKYRSEPSKNVVKEVIANLEEGKKLPVSIGFVANILYDQGDDVFADKLMDLQVLLKDEKFNVNNVGFLLSTKSTIPSKDTYTQVENHLNTTNPNLVFVSLGIDNPSEIVEESFKLARERLLNIKQDEAN
ncbi:MAG TPA: Hachiman antiphage defense system protein HamA [Paludibacter sp.]